MGLRSSRQDRGHKKSMASSAAAAPGPKSVVFGLSRAREHGKFLDEMGGGLTPWQPWWGWSRTPFVQARQRAGRRRASGGGRRSLAAGRGRPAGQRELATPPHSCHGVNPTPFHPALFRVPGPKGAQKFRIWSLGPPRLNSPCFFVPAVLTRAPEAQISPPVARILGFLTFLASIFSFLARELPETAESGPGTVKIEFTMPFYARGLPERSGDRDFVPGSPKSDFRKINDNLTKFIIWG